MKDFLLDILKNTQPLGDVILAVDSTKEKVEVTGHSVDSQIIMVAEANNNVEQLSNHNFVFGLSKLQMLRKLIQYYKDKKSNVSLKTEQRKEKTLPTEIVFESPNKSVSKYRLTHETVIPEQYERVEWDFDLVVEQPSKTMLSDFAELYSIYKAVDLNFQVKTQDDSLYLIIGDEGRADHGTMFKFADNIGKSDIKSGNKWNAELFINILRLGSEAHYKVSFSTDLIQVDIDTGTCSYTFYLNGSF